MACRLVSTMVCGDNHTLCITDDGTVCSFGRNERGSHGHEESMVFPPKVIPSLTNISSIDCGTIHTICLDYEGNVFTFGGNSYGQLGVGNQDDPIPFTYIPQRVDLPPIKQVACGYNFTICISERGSVFSFGDNYYGQLGLGNHEKYQGTQLIESLMYIDFAECGDEFTICKGFDGCVYVWGRNTYGQLGTGDTKIQNKPFKYDWKDEIVDIKCGYKHVLILSSNQQVYSCGYNCFGQLGRKTDDTFTTDYLFLKS